MDIDVHDVAVRGVTAAELRRYRTLFLMFDGDGSGEINVSELANILPRMGIFLAEDELNRLFSALDADGSGDLSFDEFVEIVVHHRQLTQLSLVNDKRSSLSAMRDNMQLGRKLWPDAPFRCTWDIIISVMILVSWVLIPLEISCQLGDPRDQKHCFTELNWQDGTDPNYSPFHILFSLIFIADVVIRLITIPAPSYLQPASMFTADWKVIFRRQASSPYFVVDVIAALPLDFIFPDYYLSILRLVKVMSFPNLFPVAGKSLVTPGWTTFHYQVLPLFKLGWFTVFLIHIMTWVWLLVSPRFERDDDEMLWTSRYGRTSEAWREMDKVFPSNQLSTIALVNAKEWFHAFYFVVYTVTTIGYGNDIGDHSFGQKIVVVVLCVFALLINAIVVGQMVKTIQQADLSQDMERKMLETVQVLRHLSIPPNFQEEILAFQNYRLQTSVNCFADTLSGLPQPIKDRMDLYHRIKVLRNVTLFKDMPDICMARLAQALDSLTVPPDEHIIIAGEEATDMYFLLHGMCCCLLKDGTWVAAIKRGGFFGELSIGDQRRRTVSIKSLTYCQLFQLKTETVADVAEHFPALREQLSARQKKDDEDELLALQRQITEGSDDGMDGQTTAQSWGPVGPPFEFNDFCGPNTELSGFWPCTFFVDGFQWMSTEHYFQAQKFGGNRAAQDEIRVQPTAEAARRLGKERRPDRPLVADWDVRRDRVMRDAMRYKFAQDAKCRTALLATRRRPILFQTMDDDYWGLTKGGEGENRFGMLLEEVREEIQQDRLHDMFRGLSPHGGTRQVASHDDFAAVLRGAVAARRTSNVFGQRKQSLEAARRISLADKVAQELGGRRASSTASSGGDKGDPRHIPKSRESSPGGQAHRQVVPYADPRAADRAADAAVDVLISNVSCDSIAAHAAAATTQSNGRTVGWDDAAATAERSAEVKPPPSPLQMFQAALSRGGGRDGDAVEPVRFAATLPTSLSSPADVPQSGDGVGSPTACPLLPPPRPNSQLHLTPKREAPDAVGAVRRSLSGGAAPIGGVRRSLVPPPSPLHRPQLSPRDADDARRGDLHSMHSLHSGRTVSPGAERRRSERTDGGFGAADALQSGSLQRTLMRARADSRRSRASSQISDPTAAGNDAHAPRSRAASNLTGSRRRGASNAADAKAGDVNPPLAAQLNYSMKTLRMQQQQSAQVEATIVGQMVRLQDSIERVTQAVEKGFASAERERSAQREAQEHVQKQLEEVLQRVDRIQLHREKSIEITREGSRSLPLDSRPPQDRKNGSQQSPTIGLGATGRSEWQTVERRKSGQSVHSDKSGDREGTNQPTQCTSPRIRSPTGREGRPMNTSLASLCGDGTGRGNQDAASRRQSRRMSSASPQGRRMSSQPSDRARTNKIKAALTVAQVGMPTHLDQSTADTSWATSSPQRETFRRTPSTSNRGEAHQQGSRRGSHAAPLGAGGMPASFARSRGGGDDSAAEH